MRHIIDINDCCCFTCCSPVLSLPSPISVPKTVWSISDLQRFSQTAAQREQLALLREYQRNVNQDDFEAYHASTVQSSIEK